MRERLGECPYTCVCVCVCVRVFVTDAPSECQRGHKGLSEDIECPNGDFNGHKSKSRIIKADESASFRF